MNKNNKFYNINILKNNKIYYEYNILEEINAGICLKGWEIKSIRYKKININNSFISIKNKEIYLLNSYFIPTIFSKEKNILYINNKPRKLLLHKKEINILYEKIKSKNFHIVVLSIFLKNNKYVKIKLGIAKRKKNIDKRLIKKNRDWKINKNRLIKNKY